MKFFAFRRFLSFILFFALSLPPIQAQGNRDFMRETGKIYVVVAVIVVIFIGIVAYLVRLDRKLTNLEHHIRDNHER